MTRPCAVDRFLRARHPQYDKDAATCSSFSARADAQAKRGDFEGAVESYSIAIRTSADHTMSRSLYARRKRALRKATPLEPPTDTDRDPRGIPGPLPSPRVREAVCAGMGRGLQVTGTGGASPGAFLFQSDPYGLVLFRKHIHDKCHWCLRSVRRHGRAGTDGAGAPVDMCEWVACPKCSYAIYCSSPCRRRAWDAQHKRECGRHFFAAIPEETLLAWRLVARASEGGRTSSSCNDSFSGSEARVPDECTRINRLVEHTSAVSLDALIEYQFQAILLHWYVNKNSAYSAVRAKVPMLLRLMCQIRCNAVAVTHRITRINARSHVDVVGETRLGLALYLEASLLNHACAPNARIDFFGRTLRAWSGAALQPGDQVLISYGPQAGRSPRRVRRAELLKHYSFECKCTACIAEAKAHVNASRSSSGSARLLAWARDRETRGSRPSTTSPRVTAVATPAEVERETRGMYLALVTRLRVLPRGDPARGRAQDALAAALASRGHMRAAGDHAEAACRAAREAFGPHSPEFANEAFKCAQIAFNARAMASAAIAVPRAQNAIAVMCGGREEAPVPVSTEWTSARLELVRMAACLPTVGKK